MAISDMIRTQRRKLDLTQAQLAIACGVSPGCVAQWEQPGDTNRAPSEKNRRLLAEILQLPIGDLIEGAVQTSSENPAFLGNPKESALVQLFRTMTPTQQAMQLKVFYAFTGVREPVEQESAPGDRASARARR